MSKAAVLRISSVFLRTNILQENQEGSVWQVEERSAGLWAVCRLPGVWKIMASDLCAVLRAHLATRVSCNLALSNHAVNVVFLMQEAVNVCNFHGKELADTFITVLFIKKVSFFFVFLYLFFIYLFINIIFLCSLITEIFFPEWIKGTFNQWNCKLIWKGKLIRWLCTVSFVSCLKNLELFSSVCVKMLTGCMQNHLCCHIIILLQQICLRWMHEGCRQKEERKQILCQK